MCVCGGGGEEEEVRVCLSKAKMTTGDAGKMEGIQHRMGKKIAQLTKVIYHLNNKNEDHEFDLQDVENQYECEIQNILQDTASKLNRFQAELRTKTDSQRVERATKKLEEEHARQVEAYDAEVRRLREKSMVTKANFDTRVGALVNELQHVKGEFTARLLEFKAVSVKCEEAGVADARDKVLDLEQRLRKTREDSEAKLQQERNRYSEMLAERTTKEEELSVRLREMAAEVRRGKAEYDVAIEAERRRRQDEGEGGARRLAEALDECARERREAEEEWKAKVESLIDQIEGEKQRGKEEVGRLRGELEGCRAEASTARDEATSLGDTCKAQERKIADLERDFDQLKRRSEETKAALTADASAGAKDLTEKLEASLLAREALHRDLESARSDLEVTRESQRSLQRSLEDAKAKLLEETERAGKAEKLERKISSDLESVRSSRDKVRKDLEASKEESDRLRAALAKAKEGQGTEAGKAREQARKEGQRRMEQVQEEHRKRIAKMEKDHAQELEQRAKDAATRLGKSEDAMKQKMAALRKELENQLAQHAKEHKVSIAQLEEQKQLSENDLKGQISDLMQRLGEEAQERKEAMARSGEESERAAGDLRDARAKISQLEGAVKKHRDGEQGLRKRLQDMEQAAKDAGAREQKLERAKAELQAAKDASEEARRADSERAKQRLARELNDLDREWSKKAETRCKEAMAETVEKHAAEVCRIREELAAEKAAALEDLRSEGEKRVEAMGADHSAEVSRLENELLDERAGGKKRAAEHKAERERELRELKEAAEEDRRNLEAKHASAVELLERRRQAELESALEDAESERQRQERDLRGRHADEVARMQGEQEELVRGHEATTKAREAEWEDRLAKEIGDLGTRHQGDLSALQKQLSDDFFAQIQAADLEHQKRQKALERDGDAARSECEEARKRGNDLEARLGMVTEERDAISSERTDLERALGREKRDHAESLQSLRREVEETLRRAEQKHEAAMADLARRRDEEAEEAGRVHEGEVSELSEQMRELRTAHDLLTERFESRESREEDLAEIERLKQESAGKDELLNDTMEKMKRLQIELLNREESYNKNFANGGSAPTKKTSGQDAILSWMLKNKKEARIDSARRKTGAGQPAMMARRQSMF